MSASLRLPHEMPSLSLKVPDPINDLERIGKNLNGAMKELMIFENEKYIAHPSITL